MSDSPVQQQDLFEEAGGPAPLPDDLPFRVTPRSAGDVDLEKLNRQEGHTRARRYLPAEEALEMIASARSTAARSRLLSWTLHPDERVPVALMDKHLVSDRRLFKQDADSPWIGWVLATRGLEAAREEDHIWNPLLDRASCHSRMWRPGRWKPANAESDKAREELAEIVDVFPKGGYRDHNTHLKTRVAPWIAEQDDPRRLEALLRFRSAEIWQAVAEHATCFDRRLIDALLRAPMTGALLARRNKVLTDDQREVLLDAVLDRLEAPDHLPSDDDEGRDGRPIFRGRRYGFSIGKYSQALKATLLDLSRRRSVDPEISERLLALAQPPGWSEERGFEGVPDDYSDPRRRVARGAAEVLLATEPVRRSDYRGPKRSWCEDPDVLRRTYPYVADRSHSVRHVLKHPLADLDLWREVASDTSFFKAREWLADREEARTDPVIRDVLATSTSPDVLIELCRDADADKFRYYFRRAARGNARKTARVLDDLDKDRLTTLEPADLMPLLTSEHQEVRAKGMLAMGRLREEGEVPDADIDRSSPSRTR